MQRKTPAARVPLNGAVALHVIGSDAAAMIEIEIESTPGTLTSRTVTLAVIVAPDAAVAVAGAIVTKSSAVPAVTVIAAVAELPSELAEIRAEPAMSSPMGRFLPAHNLIILPEILRGSESLISAGWARPRRP